MEGWDVWRWCGRMKCVEGCGRVGWCGGGVEECDGWRGVGVVEGVGYVEGWDGGGGGGVGVGGVDRVWGVEGENGGGGGAGIHPSTPLDPEWNVVTTGLPLPRLLEWSD